MAATESMLRPIWDGRSADAIVALEALPLYHRYRNYRPVGTYRDKRLKPWPEKIDQRLLGYLAIPFGQLASELAGLNDGATTEGQIQSALRGHAAALSKVVTDASQDLAHLIPTQGTPEEKAQAIANIIVFLSDLGLREASAQAGYLIARYDRPDGHLQAAISQFSYESVQASIALDCFQSLNDVARFVPVTPSHRNKAPQ